jgi:hypothetical protein
MVWARASATTLWGNALTFKAEGVEYQLWLPRTSALSILKSGDTITVEGTFTTTKADTKVSPIVHPFKVTDNFGPGRGGMMGGNGYRR